MDRETAILRAALERAERDLQALASDDSGKVDPAFALERVSWALAAARAVRGDPR